MWLPPQPAGGSLRTSLLALQDVQVRPRPSTCLILFGRGFPLEEKTARHQRVPFFPMATGGFGQSSTQGQPERTRGSATFPVIFLASETIRKCGLFPWLSNVHLPRLPKTLLRGFSKTVLGVGNPLKPTGRLRVSHSNGSARNWPKMVGLLLVSFETKVKMHPQRKPAHTHTHKWGRSTPGAAEASRRHCGIDAGECASGGRAGEQQVLWVPLFGWWY